MALNMNNNNNIGNGIYTNATNDISSQSNLFKWDPNNIKIKSLTVEKTLEPLVMHVTTLVNKTGPSEQSKGQSVPASVLIATMENAINIFMIRGQEIAQENPSMANELHAALNDLKNSGQQMNIVSRKFAEDPCSGALRADIVNAARPLLLSVTRLLVVADMIDVQRLLNSLQMVEKDLANLKNAFSQQEVLDSKDAFWNNTDRLIGEVDLREQELKEWKSRCGLAAARAVLQKNRSLLLSASKVYVRHPEISEARENRDFAFAQISEAVKIISDVAQDKDTYPNSDASTNGLEESHKIMNKLAVAIDDFDERVVVDPYIYNEETNRPALEALLENIIKASAAMADFECAVKEDCRICKDKLYERQDLFVDECNSVRQALQDVLSEYMSNAGTSEISDGLYKALDHMYKKTNDLRRHLRQAAIDHVSYKFHAQQNSVTNLIDAARGGDEISAEQYAQALRNSAKVLTGVAYLNTCMSNNEVGNDQVNHSIKEIDKLCIQVINAATIIRLRNSSKAALENMEEFKKRWIQQVNELIDSVHRIVAIEDLLSLAEFHSERDKIEGLTAFQKDDKETFERISQALSSRFANLCRAIEIEISNYDASPYTEAVHKANASLKKSKDTFDRFQQNIIRSFGDRNRSDMNKADFERTVNDLIVNLRQVRSFVRPQDQDQDSETDEYDDNTYESRGRLGLINEIDEFPDVAGISNTRDAYRFISDEDKQKIAIYVENFKNEKNKFDQEVGKWDDNGNDIIAMAKKMCKIMMDMTDFTRGRGPLKTTMDIINAAKKISEYGTELDKIANQIADQSPESQTKRDLIGYLKEIALYCHQLNITSKVKADVQNISGSLIVSGLDSATSLIQAAKNLMNAVVSTVKATYVASTMYTQKISGQQMPQTTIVKWRVKAPEKKPLVRKERTGEAWTRIQRAPRKRNPAPLRILNEFSQSG